jgi:Cys-tRNA(Pro)/Cys-tRNA(Cys) deacylase
MAKKSKHGKHGGATRAIVTLERAGVDFDTHPYDVDPQADSYAGDAALALDVPEAAVFKTLVALVDAEPVLALVPADTQLDLKALANSVGGVRAQMAEPHDAERLTGYVVGGISPLGTKRELDTIIDSSAVDLATIYVSAGKRGLQLSLRPQDLLATTAARTAPIARRT